MHACLMGIETIVVLHACMSCGDRNDSMCFTCMSRGNGLKIAYIYMHACLVGIEKISYTYMHAACMSHACVFKCLVPPQTE